MNNSTSTQIAPCDEIVVAAHDMRGYMLRLEELFKFDDRPQRCAIVKHLLFEIKDSFEIRLSTLPHKVIYLKMGNWKYEFEYITDHNFENIYEYYRVNDPFFQLDKQSPANNPGWSRYTCTGNKAGALEVSRNLMKLLDIYIFEKGNQI